MKLKITRFDSTVCFEQRIPGRYEDGAKITIRKTFLHRESLVVRIVDDEQPWLLWSKTWKPTFDSSWIRCNLSNRWESGERLFCVLFGACIDPKYTPKAIGFSGNFRVLSSFGQYLCLFSDANLQQNCVFPDPARPKTTNLFCVWRGPVESGVARHSFNCSSSLSRPVKTLLTACGVKKCLFRYAKATAFCADSIEDSSFQISLCTTYSRKPLSTYRSFSERVDNSF